MGNNVAGGEAEMLEQLVRGAGFAKMVAHADAGHRYGMGIRESFGDSAPEAAGDLAFFSGKDGAGAAGGGGDGDGVEGFNNGGVDDLDVQVVLGGQSFGGN